MRYALCVAAVAACAAFAAPAHSAESPAGAAVSQAAEGVPPAQGAAAEAAVPTPSGTISIDEISIGMKGYGVTVMRGTATERFEVEVLGVLRGIAPQRNGILVRLSGLNLDVSGVIAGMSGSPVYIDNRLAGAVAFGWPWPKEPICGVTPIGDMERAYEAPEQPAASPSWQSFDIASLLAPGRGFEALAAHEHERGFDGMGLRDLALPLAVPALSPQAREVFLRYFPPDRFILAEGTAGGKNPGGTPGPAGQEAAQAISIAPGGGLFAALVTGDMTMGAMGTATDVRGNVVFGFGHPFLNKEEVAIPMYTAQVYTIFASTYRSFKIGIPLKEVGALTRDRATGVFGVVGEKAKTVPMTVTVDRGGAKTVYHYSVLKHYAQTPALAASVAAASITTLGDLAPETTLSYDFGVSYAGGKALKVKWQAAGDDAVSAISKDIASALGVTMFNPLQRLDPGRIDLSVAVEARNASALIESATLRENEVHPGDKLHAVVTLLPALAVRVKLAMEMAIPGDAAFGQKSLVICDARTSDALDIEEVAHLKKPRSIDEVLEILTPRRSPGEVVGRLAETGRGVALGSAEFPRLPSSALAVLSSPGDSSASPLLTSLVTSIETGYVTTGKIVLPVNVTPRPEAK